MTERVDLPYDAEAERFVAAACIVDPAHALPMAAGILGAHDFYRPAFGNVFAAARALQTRGSSIDVVTLRDELARCGALESCGGMQGLGQLIDGIPTISNVGDWAAIVARDARRRRALLALEQAKASILEDPDAGVGSALSGLIASASAAGGSGPKSIEARMQDLDVAAHERLTAHGGIVGLRTGLADLDRILGGLQPGSVTTIAALTSEGKTSLCGTIGEELARQGHPVLLFSLEMTARQLDMRRLCAELGEGWPSLRRAWRHDAHGTHALVAEARVALAARPLHVDDARPLTASQMIARAEAVRAQQHGGLAAVFVDYIQLVKPEGRADDSRVRQLGQLCADLKAMAARLDVPVVAASQLNRSSYARKDGAPGLGDLRDSGEIAEAADAVVLIDRAEQRLGAACPDEKRGVADIIVAKNRLGRTGRCRLRFDPGTTTFSNLACHGVEP